VMPDAGTVLKNRANDSGVIVKEVIRR